MHGRSKSDGIWRIASENRISESAHDSKVGVKILIILII